MNASEVELRDTSAHYVCTNAIKPSLGDVAHAQLHDWMKSIYSQPQVSRWGLFFRLLPGDDSRSYRSINYKRTNSHCSNPYVINHLLRTDVHWLEITWVWALPLIDVRCLEFFLLFPLKDACFHERERERRACMKDDRMDVAWWEGDKGEGYVICLPSLIESIMRFAGLEMLVIAHLCLINLETCYNSSFH